MDTLLTLISNHAHHAHWILFGSLILAGFCIPISEDLVIIFGAMIASTTLPENTILLFSSIFLGCYFSDWICYWMGRILGVKLWNFSWFSKTVDPKRLTQIENYYKKYGFYTLLIGRFIPFGVRNCLFLAAGAGKMHFGKFILCDGIACFLSNITLFTIAFFAGKNYQTLIHSMKILNIFIFITFAVSIIGLIWYKRKTSYTKTDSTK